jgi:hypothetical protein
MNENKEGILACLLLLGNIGVFAQQEKAPSACQLLSGHMVRLLAGPTPSLSRVS